MSWENEQIRGYIKEIAQSDLHTYSKLGFVESVDKDALTCTVRGADKTFLYTNVRLKEITKESDKEKGIWLIPAEKSRVIINLIGYNQAYISMVSEIEEIKFVVEDTTFDATKDGFILKRKPASQPEVSLKDILTELLTAITQLTVTTGVGPSGTPINVVDFEKVKNKVAQLFKE